MTSTKNRLLSGLLSLLMVLLLVIEVFPPIEIHAISPEEGGKGNLYISSPSHDDEINGYEDVKIRWNKVSGAHHYWLTVKDTAKNTNLFNKSVGTKTSYTFSYDDDIFVTDGRIYKIYVAAMDADGNVLNGASEWNAIYVTNYLELDYDITVETIDTDGEQTMNTIEMCAELYIDSNVDIGSAVVGFEYGKKGGTQKKSTDSIRRNDGDEFGWTLTGLQAGTSYTYRGFVIDPITNKYVYGDSVTITTLDESDYLPEVYTDSATDITLNSAVINGELEYTADVSTEYGFILGTGVTEQVKIGTSTKVKSFEYEWEYLLPNTQYTYKTYAKNKYGTVYGNTKTFTTKSDTAKPVIEILESSLGNEFTYGSTVTFTAEASDNIALREFALYIDDTRVDYSDYYTDYNELEYTTSSLTEGTHVLKAYAKDGSGNDATMSINIVVKEAVPDGVLGDVNLDGSVSDMDQFIFKRYLDNISGYTVNLSTADINGDGKATLEDYNILKNHLVSNNGYSNLYDFNNKSTSTVKPSISGVSQVYYTKKGDSLTIPFTLTALNGGKIEKVTMKHNFVGTSFTPISFTCDQETYSNSFEISGYPMDQIGTHTFVIYCRASNYTVTNNEIIIFNVCVTEKKCNHDNTDDQYLRTVYTGTYKTLIEHTYYHEYKSVCIDCGYEICTVSSDSVTEGHKLNAKGYCLCGYIDRTGFAQWEGYNSFGSNITVYSNPESTGKYGVIYPNEKVTVLGECCGRYLIKYKVDSGGTKEGYVESEYIGVYSDGKDATSQKYSLEISDKYSYSFPGWKILCAEQYDYFSVKILDQVTGKYINYTQDSSLIWKLESSEKDSIDIYGTLCVRSEPGSRNELQLYYNGQLVDSIAILVTNDRTRMTTFDCTKKWENKLLFVNDYCIIDNYSSVYNPSDDTYTVTMSVYNNSPVVWGIGVMEDDKEDWIDFQLINAYWEDITLVDKAEEAFLVFEDLFTESIAYVAYLENSTETKVQLTVPSGGQVVFVGSADSYEVLNANIAEFVIAILSTSEDFVSLVGASKQSSSVSNMVSNAKFRNKIMAVLQNYGLDDVIRQVLSKKDGIHAIRDIVNILYDRDNEAALKQLMNTFVECLESAPTDMVKGVAQKIESLCAKGLPPFNLILKGGDFAMSCLQTIQIIATHTKMLSEGDEQRLDKTGIWINYPKT